MEAGWRQRGDSRETGPDWERRRMVDGSWIASPVGRACRMNDCASGRGFGGTDAGAGKVKQGPGMTGRRIGGGGGGGKGEADTLDVIMMRCCSLIGKTTTQTKVMFLSYVKYVLYVLSSICAPIEV